MTNTLKNTASFVASPVLKPVTLTLPPRQPILTAEGAKEAAPALNTKAKRAKAGAASIAADKAAKAKAKADGAAITAALKAAADKAAAANARKEVIKAGPPAMHADVVEKRLAYRDAYKAGATTGREYARALNAYYSDPARPWFGTNTAWFDVGKTSDPVLARSVYLELEEHKKEMSAAFLEVNKRPISNDRKWASDLRKYAREEAQEEAFQAIRAIAADAGVTPPERPEREKKAARSYRVRFSDAIRTLYKAGREGARTNKLADDEEALFEALQAWMPTVKIDPKLVK